MQRADLAAAADLGRFPTLARKAFIWWIALTVASAAHFTGTAVFLGATGLESVIQEGPISILQHSLLAVAVTWVLAGGTLALLATTRLTWQEVFRVISFLVLAFAYINFLRERTRYGDVGVYVEAAAALRAGIEMPARYLYPPLWATILSPFTPLGGYLPVMVWFVNLVSMLVLFVLIPRTLERYGFNSALATLVGFLFCIANVPIIRTLGYMQVNIHITNLILACLLLYPHWKIASAFALALAVSIKISPVVLVLPFFLLRDLRWMSAFTAWMIVLTLIPVVGYGWSPYTDFLSNLRTIQDANPLAFRDNSFDSFVSGLAHVSGLPGAALGLLGTGVKLAFAGACVWLSIRFMLARSLLEGNDTKAAVLSAFPPLLVMMIMFSPLFWEHHAIMMGLAYLVLLPFMSRPGQWILFGIAYYMQFLTPTFDFFPWSYGRMVSTLIWVWLAWGVKKDGTSDLFARATRWMSEVLPPALARLRENAPRNPAGGGA